MGYRYRSIDYRGLREHIMYRGYIHGVVRRVWCIYRTYGGTCKGGIGCMYTCIIYMVYRGCMGASSTFCIWGIGDIGILSLGDMLPIPYSSPRPILAV